MKKGDIILVPFPFTDLSGNKNRPALVLYSDNIDVTVSFISSQVHSAELYDILIYPDTDNGLKKLSFIKLSKIATLHSGLILGKMGTISDNTLREVDENLVTLFQIRK